MLTAARPQAGLLALCLGVGVLVAVPGAGGPVVLLLLIAVVGSVLVDRYGARQLSLACLVIAGFLAPLNGLRLGGAVTAADLFLVPCVVLAVMASAATDRKPLAAGRAVRPDVLAAMLLITGGIIGSQFAGDLGASLSAIIRFGLAAVGVPLVFVAVAPTRSELKALAWAFVAGAAVNSVVGVITYNPLSRGVGLSTHSNHLAAASLLASGLAAGLFLTSARRESWLAAALWAVVVTGILKSGSRAGAIGEAILIAILLLTTGSTRILRWCVGIVVGLAVLLAFNVIPYDEQDAIGRILGRDPFVAQSDSERALYRAKALEGIEQHPLTGAGFEEARVAHNVYLQVWGAAGLLGIAGMGVLWAASVTGLVEGMARDRWVLGAAAGVTSFLVVAVASNILWDRYLWFSLALFVTGTQTLAALPAPVDAGPPCASPVRSYGRR